MKYCSIFVLSFVAIAPTYTAELAPANEVSCIDTMFRSGQHNGFCVGYNTSNRELVLLKTVCTIPAGEEQPPDLVDQAWSPGPGLGSSRTVTATFGSLVKIWSTKSNNTNNFKQVHAINTGIEDIHTLQLKVPASRLLVAGQKTLTIYHIKKNKPKVINSYYFRDNTLHHVITDNVLKEIRISLQDGHVYTMRQQSNAGYQLYDPHGSPAELLYGPNHLDPDNNNGDGKSDEEEHSNQDGNDDDEFDFEPGSPTWNRRMLRSQSQPVISSSSNTLQELASLRSENGQLRDQVAHLEQLSQEQATQLTEKNRALQSIRKWLQQQQTIADLRTQLLQAQVHLSQLNQQ